VALNDQLDQQGKVSLPIGRQSLQHSRWRLARPFTASPIVAAWRDRRLRHAWELYANQHVDWSKFARFVRSLSHMRDLRRIAQLVQETRQDRLFEMIRQANRKIPTVKTGLGAT
jgi:hypothetical protein